MKIINFVVLVVLIGTGCASQNGSRVGAGAGSGAAIGAGIGFLLGALSGDSERAVAGLAVGAAVGAGEGAYEGWKQEQDDERARQLVAAIKESNATTHQTAADSSDRAREELTRFLGVWTMEGWMQEPDGERRTVRSKVNGDVEMNYFVELAYIDIETPGSESPIWGTSMLGYQEGDGYSITTRFNTLPESIRISRGSFSNSSRTFTFSESDFRIVIRFENPDLFTAQTFATTDGGETQIEFYRFTRD